MSVIDFSKKCVGCGACVDICPTVALKLVHNEYGFYEPIIDNKKCVDCDKCTKSCPAISVSHRDNTNASFYYGWALDSSIRSSSTSGGIFSLIANSIIAEGGVVFGARYSETFDSVLMSSTEECNLDDLRRSKYCQSISNGVYLKIKDALKKQKKVLLVGTPCQISAARKIFGYATGLYLVDFMCGGVVSDMLLSEYSSYMKSKYKADIVDINMRSKNTPWSKPRMRIKFSNGKEYLCRHQLDYYTSYYYTPLFKNDACIDCAYWEHFDSDMTIADFWGYKSANIQNDEKGISLLCVYNDNGKEMFDSIKNHMFSGQLQRSQVDYAYKEKKHSREILEKRCLALKVKKNMTLIEFAKKDKFKFGRLGVLVRTAYRKVLRK